MDACYVEKTMKMTRSGEGAMFGIVALLALASAACSSNDGDENTGNQTVTPESYDLEFRLDAVPTGVEGTKCMRIRLPNTTSVAIGSIVNDISNSSHHFVVSTISPDKPEAQEEQLEPVECRPFQAPILGSP